MCNKLNGISFALIHIQFYNIGADGKHVVLNKLYDISFALIGIQFYNIDTASKTIVE
jgi:hypothetical protein